MIAACHTSPRLTVRRVCPALLDVAPIARRAKLNKLWLKRMAPRPKGVGAFTRGNDLPRNAAKQHSVVKVQSVQAQSITTSRTALSPWRKPGSYAPQRGPMEAKNLPHLALSWWPFGLGRFVFVTTGVLVGPNMPLGVGFGK